MEIRVSLSFIISILSTYMYKIIFLVELGMKILGSLRCCLPKVLKDSKMDIDIYYRTAEFLQRCSIYNKIHLFKNRTEQNKILALWWKNKPETNWYLILAQVIVVIIKTKQSKTESSRRESSDKMERSPSNELPFELRPT